MLTTLFNGNFSLPNFLLQLVVMSIVAFIVFPMRCAAQAFVADQLGDPTPRYNGRLTMNPRSHMDIFGTIMVFLFGIGFTKPIPMNPNNFRNRRTGLIMTALAGPVVGILVAIASVGAFRVCTLFISDYTLLSILLDALVYVFASVNISLSVFTMLPIPFLDGYRIVSLFLPYKWVYMIEQYSQYITLGLMLLIFSGALSGVLGFLSSAILNGILFMFRLI